MTPVKSQAFEAIPTIQKRGITALIGLAERVLGGLIFGVKKPLILLLTSIILIGCSKPDLSGVYSPESHKAELKAPDNPQENPLMAALAGELSSKESWDLRSDGSAYWTYEFKMAGNVLGGEGEGTWTVKNGLLQIVGTKVTDSLEPPSYERVKVTNSVTCEFKVEPSGDLIQVDPSPSGKQRRWKKQ